MGVSSVGVSMWYVLKSDDGVSLWERWHDSHSLSVVGLPCGLQVFGVCCSGAIYLLRAGVAGCSVLGLDVPGLVSDGWIGGLSGEGPYKWCFACLCVW